MSSKAKGPKRQPSRSKSAPPVPGAYERELAQLGATYTAARTDGGQAIKRLLEQIEDRPVIFVGSGGAFAVAQLAADLHLHATGRVARAVTPLEFGAMRLHGETALVMFSASGKHPDAAMTITAAKGCGYAVIGVVTLRPEADLPPALRGDRVQVVTAPSDVPKDGFLATNSVLAMATTLVAGRAPSHKLPATLPLLEQPVEDAVRAQCLVLYGPGHACVALDLESRLHEIGLATVQVCDYRNFAHGRHAGLARHLAETTIVAVIAPEYARIAEQTLGELPSESHIVRLQTQASWPESALDLLAGSIQLIVPAAQERRINPAKPGVAPFGRKLYHLTIDKPQPPPMARLAVRRKMASMGRARFDENLCSLYEHSYKTWLASLCEAELGGLVLDYDGTCCTTEGRYQLPLEPVRTELLRLLELGFVIGFASGRGGSLHEDLRQWVPQRSWNLIRVGLYNGALEVRLSDDLQDQTVCEGPLAEAAKRLRGSILGPSLRIKERTHQMTVEPNTREAWSGVPFAEIVREVLDWQPALPLKVLASAHSVDVVLRETSKRAVLAAVQQDTSGLVLTVGDQGHVGGNDFELLAATSASLSVDRCSSDPTRCWNLDEAGHRGPDVLLTYFRALRRYGQVLRFSWETA